MSGLEVNTKKLADIFKEWRGNESCYDNGRPVFEADELLDFAQFCLKHEANDVDTRHEIALRKHAVMVSVCTNPDQKTDDVCLMRELRSCALCGFFKQTKP